jgi:hypothetical protein
MKMLSTLALTGLIGAAPVAAIAKEHAMAATKAKARIERMELRAQADGTVTEKEQAQIDRAKAQLEKKLSKLDGQKSKKKSKKDKHAKA